MINIPGKFEGCHPFAPYFYEKWLDGASSDEDWNEGDTLVSRFVILLDDVNRFPELSPFKWVYLWEDDQGFVHCIPSNEFHGGEE